MVCREGGGLDNPLSMMDICVRKAGVGVRGSECIVVRILCLVDIIKGIRVQVYGRLRGMLIAGWCERLSVWVGVSVEFLLCGFNGPSVIGVCGGIAIHRDKHMVVLVIIGGDFDMLQENLVI